jgi:hypothetical protein
MLAGTVQGRQHNDDSRAEAVMTVLYAGTNSARTFRRSQREDGHHYRVHALGTVECGGEELWAFVPYDQLSKLNSRYRNNPQKRDPHDYMMARGIRFSDMFVAEPGTAADPAPGREDRAGDRPRSDRGRLEEGDVLRARQGRKVPHRD